jgi:hypothetical protein
MAYTMADFLREHHQHVLSELSAEERAAFLQRLPVDERLRGLAAEERLRGLAPEDRLRGLDADELRRLREELNKRMN